MSQSISSEDGLYTPSRRYLDCATPEFDVREAAAQAEKGSAEGNPDAQYLHALFLYTGQGLVEDRKTAAETFSIAASSGSRPADIVRAELERNEPEVQERLIRLRLRGEERDTDACRRLFELYDNGSECVSKDHAEAVRFYTVCAENDDVEAQNTIGFMYLMGKGIRKDSEKSVRWINAAAENGSAKAM